jgi:cytochrome c556
MVKKVALCAIAMLTVGGLAHADGLDPIAIRQVGMDLVAGNFDFVQSVVKSKGDVKPLEQVGKGMARWGKTIPAVFPAGSDKGGNTKALPEIWSDQAGFQKAAADFTDATTKLSEAAKAGDADAVAADAKLIGQSCGGCHRHYRAK